MANPAQPTYAIQTLASLVQVALVQPVQTLMVLTFVIAHRLNTGPVQHALRRALGEEAVQLEATVNACKVFFHHKMYTMFTFSRFKGNLRSWFVMPRQSMSLSLGYFVVLVAVFESMCAMSSWMDHIHRSVLFLYIGNDNLEWS
jgi:hypothetical protein